MKNMVIPLFYIYNVEKLLYILLFSKSYINTYIDHVILGSMQKYYDFYLSLLCTLHTKIIQCKQPKKCTKSTDTIGYVNSR